MGAWIQFHDRSNDPDYKIAIPVDTIAVLSGPPNEPTITLKDGIRLEPTETWKEIYKRIKESG
jgi:hypothetical protein